MEWIWGSGQKVGGVVFERDSGERISQIGKEVIEDRKRNKNETIMVDQNHNKIQHKNRT